MNWSLQVTLKLFKPSSAGCDLLSDLSKIQGIRNQNKPKEKKKKTQISIHHNNIIIQHHMWLLIIGCALIEMEIIYFWPLCVTVKSFMCCERNCKLLRLKDPLTVFSEGVLPVLFHILDIFLHCELYYPCLNSSKPYLSR